MTEACRTKSCANSVPTELREHRFCLEHYLIDVQDCVQVYLRQLGRPQADDSLRLAVIKFVMLTAAKIVPLGMEKLPEEPPLRSRLLHTLLLLVDLRDRLDNAARPRQRASAG